MGEENLAAFRAVIFQEGDVKAFDFLESKDQLESIGKEYTGSIIKSKDSPLMDKGEIIGKVEQSKYVEGEGIVVVCWVEGEEWIDKLERDQIRIFGSVVSGSIVNGDVRAGGYLYVHPEFVSGASPVERIR
jgi:hypothetical protein